LKPLGCGFVVTGYGGEIVSGEMLQALGISLVKIDGTIVRRLHDDKENFATAKGIHAVCKEIGIRTIAELVELRETVQKLKEIGIDFAQGYGVAKPAPLK
jgi:Amt family ammonium transporter